MLAALAFYVPGRVTSPGVAMGVLALVIVLSFLMISKVRYRSFKEIDLRRRLPYTLIALVAIVFWLIASAPETVLLLMAACYVVSGPGERLWWQLQRRRRRQEEGQGEPVSRTGAAEE